MLQLMLIALFLTITSQAALETVEDALRTQIMNYTPFSKTGKKTNEIIDSIVGYIYKKHTLWRLPSILNRQHILLDIHDDGHIAQLERQGFCSDSHLSDSYTYTLEFISAFHSYTYELPEELPPIAIHTTQQLLPRGGFVSKEHFALWIPGKNDRSLICMILNITNATKPQLAHNIIFSGSNSVKTFITALTPPLPYLRHLSAAYDPIKKLVIVRTQSPDSWWCFNCCDATLSQRRQYRTNEDTYIYRESSITAQRLPACYATLLQAGLSIPSQVLRSPGKRYVIIPLREQEGEHKERQRALTASTHHELSTTLLLYGEALTLIPFEGTSKKGQQRTHSDPGQIGGQENTCGML